MNIVNVIPKPIIGITEIEAADVGFRVITECVSNPYPN
jgi:hypothetical protein